MDASRDNVAPTAALPHGEFATDEAVDPRDALIAELRTKVMDLELALLHSRDFAIGAIAETGELRLANAESTIHAENQRAHISRLEQHVTRLEQHVTQLDKQLRRRTERLKELERIVASRTYKVGRLVMLPVRILKRLAR
ncbi:MAG: hypothetical protein ACO3IV_05455 [Ilumatobacteraceae bacterium]|jgi:uncharacterized coiled-coil protein SlyX